MRIYYSKTDCIRDEADGFKALPHLTKYRVEKLSRIKQEKNRQQSVAVGLLLAYALREYGLLASDLQIDTNQDGKPCLSEFPDLHYNLSHTDDYVAVVISDTEVGIDIERVREGKERLAKRFFSEEEYQMLQNEWSDEAFTRIWTRKESVIKAYGVGMRMPLSAFSTVENQVCFDDIVRNTMLEIEDDYFVQSYRINDEYWLSVCSTEEKLGVQPLEVNIRDLIE